MSLLSELHRRAILSGFTDIHQQLSETEALLTQSLIASPFSEQVNDLSPTERKVVADYFTRIRATMLACLQEAEVPLNVRKISTRWSVQTRAMFLGVTLAEMSPERLRGYGALSPAARDLITKIMRDLDRLVERVGAYLREHRGEDLSQRLARLQASPTSIEMLKLLETVVDRWQLVEFRPQLDVILQRLESPQFEIAVFGRVSSGKSSLLNHVAQMDVLPVGVTPITAVPTRILRGTVAFATISFAEVSPRKVPVEELRQYASEEENPGNSKHVTSIVVHLPSARLEEGVVLVDTPGTGSLATSGAAETFAYLPRCDLGILLVDAASTLNRDDLELLRALYDAGTPTQVLLSKADLAIPSDRLRATDYIRRKLKDEVGLDLPVHPVSTVGADEALLTAWFDQQIRPLFANHRVMAEASLQRKMVALREAVSAALQTIADRQQGSRSGTADPNSVQRSRQLLGDGDALVERASLGARDWTVDHQKMVAAILDNAVQFIKADHDHDTVPSAIALALRNAITERVNEAQQLVVELRDTLSDILESLSQESAFRRLNSTATRSFEVRGLPAADLSGIEPKLIYRPPVGASLPGIGTHLVQRTMQQNVERPIAEFVEIYGRQLQAWLKTNISRLTELYEEQAAIAREQMRRLNADLPESIAAFDLETLKTDIAALEHDLPRTPTTGHDESRTA